jgi:LPXTG-motif cell wall-anchored protein
MFVRVGYFFIIVSLIVLFVFFASYQVETPQYNLLLAGLALIFIGVFIIIRNRKNSEKAGRFRKVNKIPSRQKQKGEDSQ